MDSWQADLLSADGGACEHEVFRKIEASTRALGFEQCAFALQLPHTFAGTGHVVMNHYAAPEWMRYVSQNFLQPDPRDPLGYRNHAPKVWIARVRLATCAVRTEAQSAGQCVGWLQSNAYFLGVAGILTLSPPDANLSRAVLENRANKLSWLVKAAHITLFAIFASKARDAIGLSKREVDVLRLSADGKIASEVARVLGLSEDTINFHVKKSMAKLQSPNKTAAVVRAVRLGLLH